MAALDPRIDAYIAASADFAAPILTRLRALVHEHCPQAEETVKWSRPTFTYHGILCGMAAFKQHCAFWFWKHKLIVGEASEARMMGQFGRLTQLADLPSEKALAGYIHKAMRLNEAGINVTRAKVNKSVLVLPDELVVALKKNRKAAATFEAFSPSHRREYAEWIGEAKTPATRERRLASAIEWLAQGKPRNWKYINC